MLREEWRRAYGIKNAHKNMEADRIAANIPEKNCYDDLVNADVNSL